MQPSWNADNYQDLIVKRFIREHVQLVHEYSPNAYLDKGTTGLMIKFKAMGGKNGKTLMEYWPTENRIFARPATHQMIPVPQHLSEDYCSAIASFGPTVTESNISIFVDRLRKILDALHSKKQSSGKTQPQRDGSIESNPQHLGFYLPKREDYENARRKLLREGKKRISIDDLLDVIEEDLVGKGHKLLQSWRAETERNIEIWLQRKDEHDNGL